MRALSGVRLACTYKLQLVIEMVPPVDGLMLVFEAEGFRRVVQLP